MGQKTSKRAACDERWLGPCDVCSTITSSNIIFDDESQYMCTPCIKRLKNIIKIDTHNWTYNAGNQSGPRFL